MLIGADSKTHYQSKFSSSDQTSTASSDNIDAIRAWPMCGAVFGLAVTWKLGLPGSQITFINPHPHTFSEAPLSSLPQEGFYSITTVFIPQS